jgi:uncharacterized protein YgiM (DUF1202 family)
VISEILMFRTTFLLLLVVASSPAIGEQLYVEDKLVLNVYAEADQGSARIATIETGDAVDEIERVDNFVHVRLADGRDGWVGANYLSADRPAIIKLKEMQSMGEAPNEPPKHLTDEIARLKKQNSSLQGEIGALQKKLTAAETTVAATAATPAVHEPVEAPVEPPAVVPATSTKRTYVWVWMLAVAMAGGGGFIAGYQTLGHKVRQRFGGVKVY